MARFLVALFALALSFCVFEAQAAPVLLMSRQIGNLQCNAARLSIVKNLGATNKAVAAIDTTQDPATASAVQTAQGGLDSAGQGIQTIAQSIVTGQQAPADARDQVGQGLTTAQTALQGITGSTDPNLTDAQSSLASAISDGQDVVAQCK